MKICYVCTDPGIPMYGRKGCSTHIRETVHALQNMGHEVKVICSNVQGDIEPGEELDVIAVDPPRSRKLGFDLRHLLLDRRMTGRLSRLIESWKPAAIYERYSLYSRAAQVLAEKHRLPRLLELNAFLTREQKERIRFGWMARKYEREIIRRAPHVIVVSEPLRKEVQELGHRAEHISKMPMAVNLEKFNPSVDGAATRARLGLADKFIIGYVGTLSGWHGITLLYDMARELQQLGAPPFVFLIIGGDAHKLTLHRRKVLDAGLGDVMQFIGSIPHNDVPQHIRAMDAAIVPDTTYWSSPAKLFEYQASGVPVLAPRYPAILEALDHGVEGLIYEAGNTREMAEAALSMMRDRDRTRAMGQAARRRAEKEHSWENNGLEIMRLYREMGLKES